MSLNLGYHGGRCCGIKTVSGFEYNPTYMQSAQTFKKDQYWGKDANGSHVKSDESFFFGEAPRETAEQRLDRYIEFMHKYRPNNILEAVIVPYHGSGPTADPETGELEDDYDDDDDDFGNSVYQARWVPVLESRGFKLVTEAQNSNSGNTVQVWHLVISPETKPKSLEEKPVPPSPNPFR